MHRDELGATSLSDYLRVLRRRWWIVVACAVLVPAAAYYYSARQPSQYQASAEVYLSSQDLAGALTGISTGYVDESRLADTAATLAHTPTVAERAVTLSGAKNVAPGALLGSTSVVPSANANILTFTVTNHDPTLAARLATAYAQAFTAYRGQLDSDAVRRARKELQARLQALAAGGQGTSALANSLRDKDEQLATLQALTTSRTYVISTPQGAGLVSPQPRRDATFGLLLGLVLGIGLALLVEALDTRIRSGSEIGEYLKVPQIGVISAPPKKLLKSDQLVMMAQPRGNQAEEYRVLRTNLDFVSLAADEVRSVLITSAVEQEGKSTVAANLAIALARSGKRVCLVDLDLRRPYIDRFFHLLHGRGVTDVALGNASLDEALMEIDLVTGLEGRHSAPLQGSAAATDGDSGRLDVLVSGPLPPDPGEFVSTRKLADILAALHDRYDLVVIDSPPLLRVGDAMTLSSRVDGLIVLTRLNAVRRPMLRELSRMLESVPAAKLGYVVTGLQAEASYAGGYGYGYGYGRSYAPERAERNGRPETASGNGRGEAAREEEAV
jgi:Mrp family chromosome partitioning ATPase/capsular polysaccharide biosynthesis protein